MSMLFTPAAAAQLESAGLGAQRLLQVAEEIAGDRNVSTTGAATTALGPAFETTIVYVVVVPGTTVGTPSFFVIERSASRTSSRALAPDGFEPVVVTACRPAAIALS